MPLGCAGLSFSCRSQSSNGLARRRAKHGVSDHLQVRDVCSSCRGAGFMKEKATDSLEVSCCSNSDSYGVLANHELGACPGGVWALFFGYSFGSSSIVACSFDAGNHGPCISPRHPSARAFTKMGDLLSEAARCSLLTTQNRGPDSWCQEFNL